MDKTRIIALQGWQCLYCQIPIGTVIERRANPLGRSRPRAGCVRLRQHWDHFVPYAYMAQNPGPNWVLSCHVCNLIKSARMFETVHEARSVILPLRLQQGYEDAQAVRARLELDAAVDEKLFGTSSVEDEWLLPSQAAALIGVSAIRLCRWREADAGPTWEKRDGKVRYLRAAVETWIADHYMGRR